MGGALADQLTHVFRLEHEDRRILLMCGIAVGFASVFGTPMAGAVFGLEILAIGRMRYDALFPCMVAGIVADQVCMAWGVHHAHYAIGQIVPVGAWSVMAVVLAGIVFGIVGMLFAQATHALGARVKRLIHYANTPIATTLMAMELFGAEIGPLAAIACVTAYLFSGHTGIYHAQRVGHSKHRRHRADVPEDLRIADLASFLKKNREATKSSTVQASSALPTVSKESVE